MSGKLARRRLFETVVVKVVSRILGTTADVVVIAQSYYPVVLVILVLVRRFRGTTASSILSPSSGRCAF